MRGSTDGLRSRVKVAKIGGMGDSKVFKSLGGHRIDLRLRGDLLFGCLVIIDFVREAKGRDVGDFSIVFDEDCLDVF
jgi:hypothetical protein